MYVQSNDDKVIEKVVQHDLRVYIINIQVAVDATKSPWLPWNPRSSIFVIIFWFRLCSWIGFYQVFGKQKQILPKYRRWLDEVANEKKNKTTFNIGHRFESKRIFVRLIASI